MGKWGWLVGGLAVGVAGLWLYQKRSAIQFGIDHRSQIEGAAGLVGGLSDAWDGLKQLTGGSDPAPTRGCPGTGMLC